MKIISTEKVLITHVLLLDADWRYKYTMKKVLKKLGYKSGNPKHLKSFKSLWVKENKGIVLIICQKWLIIKIIFETDF